MDWLPECSIKFVIDEDTKYTENTKDTKDTKYTEIYYLPQDQITPFVVRYRGQFWYTVPDCNDTNDTAPLEDLTDWLSLPDLTNRENDRKSPDRNGRYRMYPIVQDVLT